MKALIAGGAGFIGSHLCKKLLGAGYQVVCVDNLLTSSDKNIKDLEGNSNFRFLNQDVCSELPRDLEADEVYHLASPASPHPDNPMSYHKLPFETMRANTQGTWMLCEFAAKKGAKFLFASTSEVYGDPLEHPQKEGYRGNVSTIGPRSVYDESKRFGETITQAFIKERSLDGRIIRIFNTYGPGMADDGRVVTEVLKATINNLPIPIFGDGSQTRSFCFVDDLVEGILLSVQKDKTRGEVFNLGNPTEFTINDLASKAKTLTNSSSEISHPKSLPEDDPHRRCPDIGKARSILGWEPRISLDEGLQIYSEYLKKE
jgi:UDP-glucuronate decarboxylase